jgi:TrpR-related protein YerC/YecD
MEKSDRKQTEDVKRLYAALCALETPDEARRFLADLCTPREVEDLSQRLEVARLLAGGTSYLEVSHATGASSTTVSRVSKCLNGPVGGYRIVLDRLDKKSD